MKLGDLTVEKGFSFCINGEKAVIPCAEKKQYSDIRWDEVYCMGRGLKIVKEVTCYPEFDALEWVLWISNEGEEKSGIITDLADCDIELPFASDGSLMKGFRPYDPAFKIINAIGGANTPEDFMPGEIFLVNGESKVLCSEGGRSSSPLMPYIEMHREGEGIIASIGWSGDWRAEIIRTENVKYQTGIPNLEFFLYPGEKVRTIRTVLMAYNGSTLQGHNRFRKFMKNYYSIMGNGQRPKQGPLALSVWGGVHSEKVIERIRKAKKYNLGVEYIWMDAGWYGNSKQPCPDEHSGDWGIHAGSWNVNPFYHPDGLKEVAEEIKKADMKFILWCEPERAISGTEWVTEHPEWFLESSEPARKGTLLLNLGNPEALQAVVRLIDTLIRDLDLSCYRQDFNLDPVSFWNHNDAEYRKGITQIKHIMGLYTFWDTLLENHPTLFIDNCASGGRRLDIELMKRSMPLWETDYTCIWNYDAEDVQSQNAGILWWLPYAGTGTGSVTGDTYRFRSSYAASLVSARWSYDFQDMGDDEGALNEYEWVRKHFEEYKKTREYFSEDYYPITMPSLSKDVWSILQFHRPEDNNGMLLAFRRSKSCLTAAKPELYEMIPDKYYEIEDYDTGEKFVYAGENLSCGGWEINIPQRSQSKLYFYRLLKGI